MSEGLEPKLQDLLNRFLVMDTEGEFISVIDPKNQALTFVHRSHYTGYMKHIRTVVATDLGSRTSEKKAESARTAYSKSQAKKRQEKPEPENPFLDGMFGRRL